MKRKVKEAKVMIGKSLVLSLILSLMFSGGAFCQDSSEKAKSGKQDPVFEEVANMPVFQDGNIDQFRNWVQKNVIYPKEAVKKGISGKVFAQFIVEKDGSVNEVKIKRGVEELNDEVIRVIKASPAWKPGKNKDGKIVRVQFVVAVNFALK